MAPLSSKFGLSLIAVSLISASTAYAKKMDIETHNYVIGKLERVLSGDNAPSRHALELRLGDLYSEKARLLGIEEAEGRCSAKDCKQSQRDRAKALAYYKSGVKGADKVQRARALVQMAHLYNSLGQEKKAIATYRQIISEGARVHGAETIGLAHSSLGDIYYHKKDFRTALGEFDKAYSNKSTANRGHALYRMAWCRFNMGQTANATSLLEKLVQSQDLLTRASSNGRIYDISFHEEVSRDLATFYARTGVSDREVQKITSFSPQRAIKSNLIFLASESDRLGRKKDSLRIWEALSTRSDLTQYERIEAQVRIAQIHYDLGDQKQALAGYRESAELWTKLGCEDKDQCEILRLRMRNFVTEWHKKDKAKLTNELLFAYITYIQIFADDLDMKYWASGIAFDLKRWKDAARLYRDSSVTAHAQLQKDPNNKSTLKIFEGALLAEIDVAERAGDLDLRQAAYDHYLNINPRGEKVTEVRYQRAQVDYERKDYKKAAARFREVALIPGRGEQELKKKAADLALDSLAFLKDDITIDQWALEFAGQFSKDKNDFLKVSRRARLNYAASIANNPKSSDSDLRRAQRVLIEAKLDGASKEEKIALFKNRLVVAERMRDMDETIVAASLLFAIPGLSEEDNNYALARKAWAAEMQLDFKSAYYLSRKIPMKGLGKAEKELRLATLAELGGISESTEHYQNFIKLTNSKLKANQIRAKLVLESNKPDRLLNAYLSDLKRTPDVLGTLAFELFVRDHDYKRSEKLLAERGVSQSPDGRVLRRYVVMKELSELDRELQRHRLIASSDALLGKSLSQRLALLAKADKKANQALDAKDWSLEILSLSMVKEQNDRLYRELAELPLPTGLSAEQKREYLAALKDKATPYKQKSEEVSRRISDLWAQSSAYKALRDDFMKASNEEKEVIRSEMHLLAAKAEGSVKSYLERIIETPNTRADRSALTSARQRVQANPFDLRALRDLRDLENQYGSDTMVVYLDERMAQTEKAGG